MNRNNNNDFYEQQLVGNLEKNTNETEQTKQVLANHLNTKINAIEGQKAEAANRYNADIRTAQSIYQENIAGLQAEGEQAYNTARTYGIGINTPISTAVSPGYVPYVQASRSKYKSPKYKSPKNTKILPVIATTAVITLAVGTVGVEALSHARDGKSFFFPNASNSSTEADDSVNISDTILFDYNDKEAVSKIASDLCSDFADCDLDEQHILRNQAEWETAIIEINQQIENAKKDPDCVVNINSQYVQAMVFLTNQAASNDGNGAKVDLNNIFANSILNETLAVYIDALNTARAEAASNNIGSPAYNKAYETMLKYSVNISNREDIPPCEELTIESGSTITTGFFNDRASKSYAIFPASIGYNSGITNYADGRVEGKPFDSDETLEYGFNIIAYDNATGEMMVWVNESEHEVEIRPVYELEMSLTRALADAQGTKLVESEYWVKESDLNKGTTR